MGFAVLVRGLGPKGGVGCYPHKGESNGAKGGARTGIRETQGFIGMGALEFANSVFGFRCMNLGFWAPKANKNKDATSMSLSTLYAWELWYYRI